MDDIDKRILSVLQQSTDRSVSEIASMAGVSQTPCWKRIKKLEETGIIKKRVALLDPSRIGLRLIGFVQIKAGRHSEAWLKKFTAGITTIPEVVECHRMTGDIDYLLKIVIPDMSSYDSIYRRLIKIVDLTDVSVSFSMERLKDTTELPLHYS
ncbi:MAG: Lrp/AsnC family transcriptional regulator [Rhodobiaceae bacterium]|nr:Lrp/AsnC family transcriptional regulator [Rhodobiaceae bacterium]